MKWLLDLLFFHNATGDMDVHWPPRLPAFSSPLRASLLIGLAVVLIAGIWYAYRREPDYVPLRRKRLLASLRTAAAALLLFIMTGAFLELSRTETNQGTLVLLLDRSASMGLADKRVAANDLPPLFQA